MAAKLRKTLFQDVGKSNRHLLDAFSFFDNDNTGFISQWNILVFLRKSAMGEEIDESFADYLLG